MQSPKRIENLPTNKMALVYLKVVCGIPEMPADDFQVKTAELRLEPRKLRTLRSKKGTTTGILLYSRLLPHSPSSGMPLSCSPPLISRRSGVPGALNTALANYLRTDPILRQGTARATSPSPEVFWKPGSCCLGVIFSWGPDSKRTRQPEGTPYTIKTDSRDAPHRIP